MKKLMFAMLVAATALTAPLAQAQTATGSFNVNVTLTSVCTLSAITAVDFAYTSLQGGVSNATNGGYTVSCTNSLPYSFWLQAGTTPTAPFNTTTINVTDNAVNLAYTLGLSAAGGTGNGLAQPYNITGTMAAGQGGTCNAATCTNAAATNRTHSLIVTY